MALVSWSMFLLMSSMVVMRTFFIWGVSSVWNFLQFMRFLADGGPPIEGRDDMFSNRGLWSDDNSQ